MSLPFEFLYFRKLSASLMIIRILRDRMLTSNVIRKGISENVLESSQLLILRQLTSACSLSVSLSCTNKGTDDCLLNRHQIQVALVEMSHVIITLGEAGASCIEDILPVLRDLLSHADAGVRQETSAVFASISQAFPAEGQKFVLRSLNSFGSNLDAIQSLFRMTLNHSISVKVKSTPSIKDQHVENLATELLKRQATLHGNSLAVSMIMHELIHLVGGVAAVIIDRVFDVVSLLLNCQFDEEFEMVRYISPFLLFVCLALLFLAIHAFLSQIQAPSAHASGQDIAFYLVLYLWALMQLCLTMSPLSFLSGRRMY